MKATNLSNRRRAPYRPRSRRRVFAILLMGLAMLLGIGPAFADQFYFTRTRARADSEQGATGLFLWNDATGAQSQVCGDGSQQLSKIKQEENA